MTSCAVAVYHEPLEAAAVFYSVLGPSHLTQVLGIEQHLKTNIFFSVEGIHNFEHDNPFKCLKSVSHYHMVNFSISTEQF